MWTKGFSKLKKKNTMTSSGFEPMTFRIVADYFKHLRCRELLEYKSTTHGVPKRAPSKLIYEYYNIPVRHYCNLADRSSVAI
jgi:hypothetical protein